MRHGTTFQTNIGHGSYARRFLLFAYATFVLGILRMFSLRVQTTPGSGDEQVSPSRAILAFLGPVGVPLPLDGASGWSRVRHELGNQQ